jgi:hypothetical protein
VLNGPIHKGIFPYVRPLPPTPNFPLMILLRQCGRCNLSPTAFHARSPQYALKRALMCGSFLRDARVSQFSLCVWCAKLVAFFCTLSNTSIFSLCINPTTWLHIQESDIQVTCKLNFWYYYSELSISRFWRERRKWTKNVRKRKTTFFEMKKLYIVFCLMAEFCLIWLFKT